MSSDAVLLVAHGTVENLDDLPAFLGRIRHGRAAAPQLLAEVRRRYELIGRSPLLEVTREQGRLLSERLGLRVEVGMRLWEPSIERALESLVAEHDRLCVVPLAPFSVHVYFEAAQAAARALGQQAPSLVCAEPWGEHEAFVAAHAELIAAHVKPSETLLFTAHSLPARAIRSGDPYQELVEKSAAAIAARSGRAYELAYQSQGEGGGEWLGPDLREMFTVLRGRGVREVALSPLGFLSEHVETLYDLDVEAQAFAQELGIELNRVPAIGTHRGLIDALADVTRRALARPAGSL